VRGVIDIASNEPTDRPRRGSLEAWGEKGNAVLSDRDTAAAEAADWLTGEIDDLRQTLAAAARTMEIGRGAALFEPGESPTGLWRIIKGAVDLIVADGSEEISVQRLGVGACVGEEASLSDTPHPFGARAATDCVVSVVRPPVLRAILTREPEWWPAFYRLAGRNLVTLLAARMELAAQPSASRLARRLLTLADGFGVVHSSKVALAECLGLTRVTVQRHIAAFARRGIIESGYRRVILRDRSALRRIAEGEEP
jgi:CRP-like cAMP-binding protein